MNPRLRDGLLALAALAALLTIVWLTDASSALTDLAAVLVGVVGSMLLEAAFLRYPDQTRELWDRPVVQAVSLALVAGVGIVTIQSGLGWILAALVWGLVAYLVLLAVVVGTGNNPLSRVVAR